MIGVSLRVMTALSKFFKRHPIVAFGILMLAMWGREQESKSKI